MSEKEVKKGDNGRSRMKRGGCMCVCVERERKRERKKKKSKGK